jgi:lipid-binding SYLF domain-containing protein
MGLGLLLALVLSGAGGCAHKSGGKSNAGGGSSASSSSGTAAAVMLTSGSAHADRFLAHDQSAGLRNMLGGARGAFIAPNVEGGAFLAGMESGAGYLMRRHGSDWSDPDFYNLTRTSAGTRIGIEDQHVIVLLMTDMAVDNFVNGTMEIGGTGGFTIANYGLSVTGAGGVSGGLELLIVSSSEGAFLGGGALTTKSSLATALNQQAYGPGMDPKAILAVHGGKYAPATPARKKLTEMVVKAWNVPADSAHP